MKYIVLIRDEKGNLTGFGYHDTIPNLSIRKSEIAEFDTIEEAESFIISSPIAYEYLIYEKI